MSDCVIEFCALFFLFSLSRWLVWRVLLIVWVWVGGWVGESERVLGVDKIEYLQSYIPRSKNHLTYNYVVH